MNESKGRKKKVLIFIDWYLPGYKAGGPIRSCANLISHLKNEFEFSVITGNTDYCEIIPYPDVISDEWNVLEDGTKVYYLSEKNTTKRNLKFLISNLKPDFIYINGIYSYKFSILPLLVSKKFKDPKIIVAARGMFAPGAIGVKKIKKLFFLKAAEISGLYKNVIFHATNENEKKDIISVLGKNVKIKTAPNLPKSPDNIILTTRLKEKGKTKLVSIARIAPEKNIKYALEILSQAGGTVEFDLYGTVYDHIYWNECLQVMKNLPQNVKVRYCGSVSNTEIDAVLQKYHFMFMPTLGENFGHSVFESLNNGCPVIISDKTPWQNLEEKKTGWALPLDNKSNFVKIIAQCVQMEQAEYDELSRNALGYARKIADDKDAVEQNRKLFL